jgi:heat shock protein HslJ
VNVFKRIIVVLLIIAVTASVFGCAGTKNAVKPEGVRWVLQSYGTSGNMTNAAADKEAWIEFKSADKSVSGNAGVNSFGGKYKIDGNKLTIDSLMQTLMAGPEPLMNQEKAFMQILASARGLTIEGQKLTITATEGILIFDQK